MEVFLYLDGDAVAREIEGRLLVGELEKMARVSHQVTTAIHEIAAFLRQHGSIHLYFAAGDNLFARLDLNVALIQDCLTLYHRRTGLTASAGAGRTPIEAFAALKVAKLRGGGRFLAWGLDDQVPADVKVRAPRRLEEPRAGRAQPLPPLRPLAELDELAAQEFGE